MVLGYRDALDAHRAGINKLNVYPVPDGDTGTNMALTLTAVGEELAGVDGDLAAVCKAISHGSLMGARGNSGVILSQILRGIAGRGGRRTTGSTPRAVRRRSPRPPRPPTRRSCGPVEGTILTVVREAVGGRGGGVDGRRRPGHRAGGGPRAGRRCARADPRDAAGAQGGGGGRRRRGRVPAAPRRAAPRGRRATGARARPRSRGRCSPSRCRATTTGGEHGDVSDLRYEVMYFLEAADDAIPAFKDVWAGIGDSIVVVGGDGIWNCHIHTDDIGASIEAAIDDRHAPQDPGHRPDRAGRGGEVGPRGRRASATRCRPTSRTPVTCAVVAVATGAGIRRIFHSLGVQGIVTGGQSMNPSTAELIEAVEQVPADQVVILPEQQEHHPGRRAGRRPHHQDRPRRAHQGDHARASRPCSAYDPEAESEANADEMAEAAANVVAGEVTQAVRDSSCDVGPIASGRLARHHPRRHPLGRGRPRRRRDQAARRSSCCPATRSSRSSRARGPAPRCTRHITEWLAEHRPAASAEVHHGGQPLYPYLFGIE